MTLPVITVLAAMPRVASFACAFCTPIAAAPSSPQPIASGASMLTIGAAASPASMNAASSASCRPYSAPACQAAVPPAAGSATAPAVRRAPTMPATNAGNASSLTSTPPPAPAMPEPIRMKLPVTWATNRPNSATKPSVST